MSSFRIFSLIIIFGCLSIVGKSQPRTTFSNLPENFQLYARNNLNLAYIPITGTVNTYGYTAVSLLVLRNNLRYRYIKQNITYINNKAAFTFDPSIQAGLYEYSFKVYAISDEDSILIASRDSVVCGDAYLISGQSNSRFAIDLESYTNEYCRTFGTTTSNGNASYSSLSDTLWSRAKANGYSNVGVWALNFMRRVVEKDGIPICIINGGVSQTKIFKHVRDSTDNHFYTQTYYGRLLYRAIKSGLQNSVKAFFWYHGESNNDELFSLYKPYFSTLYQNWKDDYPSLEKIYLFQINIGCNSTANSSNFREGQRKLYQEFPKIKTIGTIGTPNYNGCHYDTTGYCFLSRQVYKVVSTDFYNKAFEPDQNSPNINKAYYTSANMREIILEFANSDQLTWQNDTLGYKLADYFYLDGISGLISSGYCYQNKVRLLLKNPSKSKRITYLPSLSLDPIFLGPLIRNIQKIGALSFQDFEIEDPPVIGNDESCPAAFGPVKHIYGTNRSNTIGNSINQNTVWNQDTIYILHKYVRVALGATLIIDPGTVIMGAMMPYDTAVLVIQKGGKLFANGEQRKPIIFTSCRTSGTRRRGDWGGIVICGNAPNNAGNSIELEGNYKAIHGGNNKTDNSGSLQYVRIEYAGIKFNNQEETNSLTLASVGSGTIVKYVQASYSNDDSFEWFGGTVNAKYLISWKPLDDDFDTDLGYTGNNQFGIGFRDYSAADISGSCGFESDNNATNLLAIPKTSPIFSNFECWGPRLTAESPYNAFFKAGAMLKNGTEIKLYNTLILGWPGDSSKSTATILLNDAITINKAKIDSLRFRNCYIGSYLPNFHFYSGALPGQWLPYSSMKNWYFKTQGFDSTANNILYRDKKAPFKEIPLFTVSSTNSRFNRASSFMTNSLPKLPTQPNGFFQSVNYRGAFGGTDWTQYWAEFNPQLITYSTNQYEYREDSFFENLNSKIDLQNAENSIVNIYPNPASDRITIEVNTEKADLLKAEILNIEGRIISENVQSLQKGNNIMILNIINTSKGSHILKLQHGATILYKLLIIN